MLTQFHYRDRMASYYGAQWAQPPTPCPLCDHEWSRHDPEDGKCDAHSEEGFGVCQCGRDIEWVQEKIAALSNAELQLG